MNFRLKVKPIASALLSMAVCTTMAVAQDTNNSNDQANAKKSASTGTALPDLVELDPFGGISLFGRVDSGLDPKHISGGAFGGRVGANVSDHWGLELMYEYLSNNVRFLAPIAPGRPTYDFGNRIHNIALNPVFHFTRRGSRIRPYVTVGVGAAQFTPTSAAKRIARDPAVDAIYHSANLNDNLQVALNYGGGVKFHVSDHFGLRFDARGFMSRNPTYGLPDYPTGGIYIPKGDRLNGVQITAGLIFYIGQKEVPPPPPPPPPPPAPLSAGTITGTEGTLCQGKAITLHSTASDPSGHQLSYAWKLNGNAQGSNSPDFSFTPNNAGDFTVEVEVSDSTNPSRKVTGGPVTLNIKEYTEPVISNFTLSPKELTCKGDTTTAQLQSTASGSACGGNLTYKWTVSEGSVSNDSSANATFDSKSLNFDQNSGQTQTKSVNVTLTVTDETGKSTTKTDTITVKCEPETVRLNDVVFPKNSSRVNNCGKRILVDEVPAKLNDPNFNVILVGHRDKDEAPPTGRRRRRAAATSIDEARALNAAAVLTGGTGTCGKVDPSRVMIDWVADDQTSEAQPGLCGTSTRQETKERRSSQVSDADKFRRVEVYIVPKGAPMPPAVKNAKPLPESTMKKLGCPK
jgi:opacity protein-like surface antigen/outer membrane protein OmpA-like peptidoglycan-associated protein